MALCTPDDVVAYAGISDPDWDLLDALVSRAQSLIETWCGCRFRPVQCDEAFDIGACQCRVVLSHYPVQEVAAVYERQGDGLRELASDDYSVDLTAGIIRRERGYFPEGAGAVRVVYSAGYEQAPEDVVQAAVMLVADWYRNRPDGRVAREAYDGYAATYFAAAIPPAVRDLLDSYRRHRLR